MFVPVKMVVAPGSEVGWEGTGVIPDILVQKDPLVVTRELIRRDLLAVTDTTALSKEVPQWLQGEQQFPFTGCLDSADHAVPGQYSNGISIHRQRNSLLMEIKSEGQARFFQLLKVAKGTYAVLDFDPHLRPRDTRFYVGPDIGKRKLELTTGRSVENNCLEGLVCTVEVIEPNQDIELKRLIVINVNELSAR